MARICLDIKKTKQSKALFINEIIKNINK